MTAFTLAHTAVSVLPVGFGLNALARYGRIDPATRSGNRYVGTLAAGAVSGLGFIATRGFIPGQILGLVTLAPVLAGAFALGGRWRKPGYARTAALTTSSLMLMVFLTAETLKRLPPGHPVSAGGHAQNSHQDSASAAQYPRNPTGAEPVSGSCRALAAPLSWARVENWGSQRAAE